MAKKGRATVSILKSKREAHKKFVAKLSADDLAYLQNRARSGVIDGTIKDAEAALAERHRAVKRYKESQSRKPSLGLPSQFTFIKEPSISLKESGSGNKSVVEVDAGNGMKYLVKVKTEERPKTAAKSQRKTSTKPGQQVTTKLKRGSSRIQRVSGLKAGAGSNSNTHLSTRQKQTATTTKLQKTDIEKTLNPKQNSKSTTDLALALIPIIATSQKRHNVISGKQSKTGKLTQSTKQQSDTISKQDTEGKKESAQKRKQTPAVKKSSRQRLKTASASKKKAQQTTKSKQTTKTTPKAKKKTKQPLRSKEEEKEKVRKKMKKIEQAAYRFETVNTFGWIKDSRPAAKPRRIK